MVYKLSSGYINIGEIFIYIIFLIWGVIMKFNPFKEKGIPMEKQIQSWSKVSPMPYDKKKLDPYSKARVILMNGIEVEAAMFLHQFHRNCKDNDLRRELAQGRFIEQLHQKKMNWQSPPDETILESTIGYEQLAVDLTAWLAQNEPDKNVKASLDFALLEDFDHLYRYANLLAMDEGIKAEELVGKYTEIMPGRPTIAHHRYPMDNVKTPTNFKKAHIQTKLNTKIIVAGEQQTMNFYNNVGPLYKNALGRDLYLEIAMVEEEHVAQYGSLLDPTASWLENMLLHEYTECYLYYSFYQTELDKDLKALWEEQLHQELTHLQNAAMLLEKHEKKSYLDVVEEEFPSILELKPNVEYVREVLANTVSMTNNKEDYIDVKELDKDSNFLSHQRVINRGSVPSNKVIEDYIAANGEDYRYEKKEHPIEKLADRKKDNTTVGIKE